MRSKDTKRETAEQETIAMGIGIVFALAVSSFVAAVMFYLQTYHP